MSDAAWHSGRMIYALAHHFDWFQNRLMTEFFVDGGLADLAFVSRAGYVTEIEVKVSLADWKADAKKDKWRKPRPHVARFFYAYPETLSDKVPSDLPDHAGLICVYASSEFTDRCREVRAAKRLRASKLPDRQMQSLYDSCYHRYWRQRIKSMGTALLSQRRSANQISPTPPTGRE